MTYRVAELIADSLAAHGVDRAFCVPGKASCRSLTRFMTGTISIW